MKKEKKEKPLLSSDAVRFERLKIVEWVSIVLTIISATFASVMTMYYAEKPGDFGVEVPKTLAFVGIGFTIAFLIVFSVCFFMTKKMLKK